MSRSLACCHETRTGAHAGAFSTFASRKGTMLPRILMGNVSRMRSSESIIGCMNDLPAPHPKASSEDSISRIFNTYFQRAILSSPKRKSGEARGPPLLKVKNYSPGPKVPGKLSVREGFRTIGLESKNSGSTTGHFLVSLKMVTFSQEMARRFSKSRGSYTARNVFSVQP